MNKSRKLLTISCWLLAILNSCKDNTGNGNLGINALPKSDLISAYQTDTTPVVTSMYLKDSVITDQVVDCMLGSYNDPIFGETKASIYAEVIAPSSTSSVPPWTVNSTVDSAVLSLQLYPEPYYGGSDPQTFAVYQTTDSNINSSYAYYSDNNVTCNPSPMGIQQVFLPNYNAHDTLRIKLNKSWWSNFATHLEFSNQWTTNFNSLIKGIYITTSTSQLPGQGSLLNVNLLSGSAIYIYYHSNSTPGEIGVPFQLGGSSNQYFTHFDHNYTTTPLGSMHPMGKHDSVPAGQLIYVQSLGGVIGRLNFPNLYKNWSKLGPIIVNEAIISLPVEPQSAQTLNTAESSSGPPASISLWATDTGWNPSPMADPLSRLVGMSNNAYTFIVTQYIQSVINGKTVDRGLFIIPDGYQEKANSVILYGAQHGTVPANKATLTIYYTPVKH